MSYAGSDTGWAEWVAWHLRSEGYAVELAAWDWQAGEDFVARMRAAVERPGLIVVALWSAAYFEPDRFTQDEWSAARAAARRGQVILVPLRVQDVVPPRLDGPLIYDDLFGVDPVVARLRLVAAVTGKQAPTLEPVFPGKAGTAGEVQGPRLPGSLPTIWRVPPRNPAFTGRERLMAVLRTKLSGGGRLVVQALQGMGGVGKTSVATEYLHRFAADFDMVWWIDAEEPALVADQLRDLAMAARLVGPQADAGAATAAVQDWLRRWPGWVVVFDNAADPRQLLAFLPQGPGQVLITSRDSRWAQAVDGVQLLDVFVRAESTALLRAGVRDLPAEDAERIAEQLGDLPLAVAQAAAFMAESGMSATDYLRELEQHAAELLAEGTPAGYPRSLAAAVRLSLERLATCDVAALQVLQVCAFLGPEPIPVFWFAASGGVLPPPLTEVVGSGVGLRRLLRTLARLGLVQISRADSLVLHRLTAAIVRDSLADDERERIRTATKAVLIVADPGDDVTNPSTWPAWAELIPHLLALEPHHSHDPAIRWLALNATWVLLARGDLRSGVDLSGRLYETWPELLGVDHVHTLNAVTNLAEAHRRTGDYEEARRLDEDTLMRRRRVLGVDHRDTLVSASNLGEDLRALADHATARTLDEDTLDRRRRVLGEDHPHTMNSANNLAIDLLALGDVPGSRQLHEDNLARSRRVLGGDHPSTLRSANNLAVALRQAGDLAAAVRMNKDTLARMRQVLGDEHPSTRNTARNLAADSARLESTSTDD